MTHCIHAQGFSVRFRPVQMEDAPFIVSLRNSNHAKGNVGDSAVDVAGQEAWLEAYFKRSGDYYFIIETAAGIPVGTYGIYNVFGSTAEQGRFVIRSEVRAAPASAVVSLDLAFGQLGFQQLTGSTVASNHAALSFYRKLGFRQIRLELAARSIAGKEIDLVHFVIRAEEWPMKRSNIVPIAQLAEAQIREWEQFQLKKAPLSDGVSKA